MEPPHLRTLGLTSGNMGEPTRASSTSIGRSGRSKGITDMKGHTRVFRRATQLAAASLAIAGTGVVGGCLNRPIEPIEPKTTSTVVERLTESAVDKIDLVLMIDNSR